MAEKVHYEFRDGVAVARMDDGKVNAIDHEMINALGQCLDRAEREAGGVLLAGREQRFSAGFALDVITSGRAGAIESLVTAGAELVLRIHTFPRPVVVACTGHALAVGAILLLAADLRLAARGNFRIGLNEVAIKLRLPIFGLELARARLSKRHFVAATTQARVFDPETAKDAGFIDQTEDPAALFDVALKQARRLAQLPDPAYRDTKASARAATVKLIRDSLKEDMLRFGREVANTK